MDDFKAPNEFAWAAFFDALAVPYKYEALEPALSRALRYQPDFWLPDSLAWLEIKPQWHTPTPGEARVARLLVEATNYPVYICAGWPAADRLHIWGYFTRWGEQDAGNKLAMRWLMTLLNRGIPQTLAASRAVMSRHSEFVRMWRESHGKGK